MLNTIKQRNKEKQADAYRVTWSNRDGYRGVAEVEGWDHAWMLQIAMSHSPKVSKVLVEQIATSAQARGAR